MPLSLKLKTGEVGFIAGQRGTGKSQLVSSYLAPRTGRLGIIDWKGQFDYDAPIFDNAREIERRRPDRFIYRPNDEERHELGAHNRVFRFLYDRGEGFVYTDELVASLNRKGQAPPYFDTLYAMGRQRGITMLTGTQSPVSIPLITIRLADRMYLFRIIFPEDLRRIRGIVPAYQSRPTQKQINEWARQYGDASKAKHSFVYFDSATGYTQRFLLT